MRLRLLLCALLALTTTLLGQTGVGQIQGAMNDASGSVVPLALGNLEHVRTENHFKIIPIREHVNLCLNIDSFNTLNQPGRPGPGGDGIISLRTSAQGARVLQYTARITW